MSIPFNIPTRSELIPGVVAPSKKYTHPVINLCGRTGSWLRLLHLGPLGNYFLYDYRDYVPRGRRAEVWVAVLSSRDGDNGGHNGPDVLQLWDSPPSAPPPPPPPTPTSTTVRCGVL